MFDFLGSRIIRNFFFWIKTLIKIDRAFESRELSEFLSHRISNQIDWAFKGRKLSELLSDNDKTWIQIDRVFEGRKLFELLRVANYLSFFESRELSELWLINKFILIEPLRVKKLSERLSEKKNQFKYYFESWKLLWFWMVKISNKIVRSFEGREIPELFEQKFFN